MSDDDREPVRSGSFDDVPFGPAEYGHMNIEIHDGGVYLVTWKEAMRVEPDEAAGMGRELIQRAAQARRIEDT